MLNDEFLDPVLRQEEIDNWIAQKEEVYEDRIIKQLLSHFPETSKSIGFFKRELKEELGSTDFTCRWFNTRFSDFPIIIGTASTVFSHDITLSDLFKRLTNTKMFKRYEELEDELRSESEDGYTGPVGLIFPWAKLGNMVLHSNKLIEPKGTRIIRNFDDGRNTVFLDSWNSFLEEVEKNWKPD